MATFVKLLLLIISYLFLNTTPLWGLTLPFYGMHINWCYHNLCSYIVLWPPFYFCLVYVIHPWLLKGYPTPTPFRVVNNKYETGFYNSWEGCNCFIFHLYDQEINWLITLIELQSYQAGKGSACLDWPVQLVGQSKTRLTSVQETCVVNVSSYNIIRKVCKTLFITLLTKTSEKVQHFPVGTKSVR